MGLSNQTNIVDVSCHMMDIFVHHSEVRGGMLREGDQVEFEVGEGRKGPAAKNVMPAGG